MKSHTKNERYACNVGRVISPSFFLNSFIMNLWPQSATYNNICRPSSDFSTISFFTCTSVEQLNTTLCSTIQPFDANAWCVCLWTRIHLGITENVPITSWNANGSLNRNDICIQNQKFNATLSLCIQFPFRCISSPSPQTFFFFLLSFTFEMLKITRIACLCVLLQWIYNKLLLLIL